MAAPKPKAKKPVTPPPKKKAKEAVTLKVEEGRQKTTTPGKGKTKQKKRNHPKGDNDHWHYKEWDRTPNEEVFLNALENGLGLSRSAVMAGYTPKSISELLTQDTEFFSLAEDAMLRASELMLIVTNRSKSKKDWDSFKLNQQALERMIITLNMWECYDEKEFITHNKVINAIVLYRYPEEIATSLGMTLEEYTTYLLHNPFIYEAVERSIGITGLK